MGVRAPRPLRLPCYLCQARCMSPPCPLRVPPPCPRRAPGAVASLCPAGETRGGLWGAREPPGPAAPSCLPQVGAAPSHNPPISPHLHAGSNCSWGCWWLINHGDDLLIMVTTWGPGKSPVNPLPSSCAAGTNPASCFSWSRAVRSVRAVINLIVALSPRGEVADRGCWAPACALPALRCFLPAWSNKCCPSGAVRGRGLIFTQQSRAGLGCAPRWRLLPPGLAPRHLLGRVPAKPGPKTFAPSSRVRPGQDRALLGGNVGTRGLGRRVPGACCGGPTAGGSPGGEQSPRCCGAV